MGNAKLNPANPNPLNDSNLFAYVIISDANFIQIR